MTSPRTILSAIAVAAALTIGLAPAAHAEPTESSDTSDTSDAGGTASPEPSPPETDDPVEPTDDPTDDPTAEPDPTSQPSVEPTTVAPTTVPTTQPQPTTTAPAPTTTTPAATSTTTSSVTPTSGTTATGTSTTGTPTPVFYENCSAVHAAGQPFLFTWEPGYATDLDRDLDGIACEWREQTGGTDEDRHHGSNPDDDSDDSWCTDNDWRALVVTIPVTTYTNTSSYTYYGDDDLGATYTQWPTVPDGPIATGTP